MTTFTLTINGRSHAVEAPSEMPLLWVLRDLLGLTGTKFGCGIGQCRACTVHLDGQPVPSCQLPIGAAVDRSLTTIEGLAEEGKLHPVQQAWIDEQVPQCGYCQSGQIMGAVALLESNPKPTEAEIDAVMQRHICRCGTYARIRKAIQRAAGSES